MRKEKRLELGEFWLDKRTDLPEGPWYIFWYDEAKRQTRHRSTRTGDFELAEKRLADHYLNHGKRDQVPADQAVIRVVVNNYAANYGKTLASTKFVDYAATHWARFWKDDTLSAMVKDRMEEFAKAIPAQAKADGRRLKPGTVNRVLGVGRAAIRRAVENKELTEAPKVYLVGLNRTIHYRATAKEIAAHLNAAASMPWVRQWQIGSITTLARPATVLRLARPQIHLDIRRIDLLPPEQIVNDKGRPIIPMTDTAFQWLGSDWTGFWITYPTELGPRPLASIRMGFERARKRAGLSSKISPYTYRRTMATMLRAQGVPPWEIAGFMGHTVKEFEITEQYAIYSPDYLSRAAQAIDAYCADLQPMLDFDLRSTCVPVPEQSADMEQLKMLMNQVTEIVGRLGLEPRTNTLKAAGFPSTFKRLKIIK